ncbi:MAG: putative transposase [Arcticibacterium sp.]|jgi:putative transposase
MLSKKMGTLAGGKPSAQKEIVIYLKTTYKASIECCKLIKLHRSMWYYQSKKNDSEVIDKLNALAESHPTRGFDEYFERIRQQGFKWNRKRKKRLPSRVKQPLVQPLNLNQTWSIDFMSDSHSDGRRVRVINVIDDCNREDLAIEAGICFPALSVIRVLSQLEEEVGLL